ncbi:cellulose biosynthesis protein BcsE [Klebsiella sp. WP4-W18-ESBL-05]|uniref:cellulose biosynthesis protein BcsE n=1 Tax=Enterobacteriaceae TaxID=543 RepID=UPI0015DBD804|nr:cellulose biosynthesis protein BcsE [Klebsiella sp. WP4-W18-ESBL-05]BBR56899.1 cellulose biosynthesis protein BcsE [Klebsiella sp. WP4-W18-ESBL-05]HAT3955280.1 cellulose biosynthesis protein BcsE [Kluyvera ascorbata]
MNPIFSIGIQSLWDEVSHMPAGGVWWVNTDRHEDAVSLLNQTLSAQADSAKVAVVSMGENPNELIALKENAGPKKISLFAMHNSQNGLDFMRRDLLCTLEPKDYFVILLCSHNAWEDISGEKLIDWINKSQRWAKYYHCTLLVLNPGNNADALTSLLLGGYGSLSGLANLRYQGDSQLLDISYWANEKGVSARQQLLIKQNDNGWHLAQDEVANVQPRSDEKQVLSNIDILEGAPALSEHWTLFDTNDAVFNAARTAQAATVIFSLRQNSQVEQLAHYIHTLRRQRGSALKIITRETTPSLRATDERLLLSCGANLVISASAPLSRSLTLIESVQTQQFNRHVPEDLTTLLANTEPLKLKGYQKWDVFCDSVQKVINNTLLPADSKGVMVALRPAPGLRVEQVLTLCRPHRMGDIVTIADRRLVMFLPFCRVNDLDTALNHIFPLPTGDIFSNRMIWFEDKQIASELLMMREVTPERWTQPLDLAPKPKNVINATYEGNSWRRYPEPHRLSADTEEKSS